MNGADQVRGMHAGQVHPVDQVFGEGIAVDLPTTDEKSLLLTGLSGYFQGLFQGTGHQGPGRFVVGGARHDDVGPAFQRPVFEGNAFPVLPAGDHMVPHRGPLEESHVVGQVPGQVAIAPDHLVLAHGGDGADDHTETAALMCGCGS
jgi:hypothetical protein